MEIENHTEEVPFSYYEEKFLTFSPEEIRSLPDETGFAQVNCQFCNKSYRIGREELEALACARENAET